MGFHYRLEKLFESKEFSDFTIIVSEREFHVHKLVLSISSAYFQTLFRWIGKEKEQTQLEIKEHKWQIIHTMIHYFYSDRIEFPKTHDEPINEVDLYSELLVAADMYQVSDLKTRCETALRKLVTRGSVDELMILSGRFSLRRLRISTARFILEEDGYKVSASPRGSQMANKFHDDDDDGWGSR